MLGTNIDIINSEESDSNHVTQCNAENENNKNEELDDIEQAAIAIEAALTEESGENNGLKRDQSIESNENAEEQRNEGSENASSAELVIETMLDEQNLSPASCNEPMECSSLASQNSPKEEAQKNASTSSNAAVNEDVVMSETASLHEFNVS